MSYRIVRLSTGSVAVIRCTSDAICNNTIHLHSSVDPYVLHKIHCLTAQSVFFWHLMYIGQRLFVPDRCLHSVFGNAFVLCLCRVASLACTQLTCYSGINQIYKFYSVPLFNIFLSLGRADLEMKLCGFSAVFPFSFARFSQRRIWKIIMQMACSFTSNG